MGKRKEALPMEIEKIKLPIKWNVPETVITRFASNLVVQRVEGYFKLLFFEIKPDISVVELNEPPSEVVADCVGSIIVPPEKIQAIIDLLTRQLEQNKTAGSAKSKEPS